MATAIQTDIDLEITRLEYGDTSRPQRAVLEIATRKYYDGGLISDAAVYWVGEHMRSNCMSLGGNGGDYTKRLLISAKTVKATQKAIDRQHAAVFVPEVVEQLMGYAKLHYSGAITAGVDGFMNTYPRQHSELHAMRQ